MAIAYTESIYIYRQTEPDGLRYFPICANNLESQMSGSGFGERGQEGNPAAFLNGKIMNRRKRDETQ